MAHSNSSDDSDNHAIVMPPTDANADPESPNAAQQSSDESGCSDGVLVELPGNNDQDSRSPGDPESGILVNIDGSMQEPQDREDLFLDASEHLGSGGRTPRVVDSVTVVEPVDALRRRRLREQDPECNQARLDALTNECSKYEEEMDVFKREVLAFRAQLHGMIDQQFMNREGLVDYLGLLLDNREPELDVVASSTLHGIVKECSKFVVHLKCVLDECLNSEVSMLNAKDQEIELLYSKILEDDVFQSLLMSYLSSFRGDCSQSVHEFVNVILRRLLTSLPVMTGEETDLSEELLVDGIHRVEERIMLFVEKHNKLLFEIEKFSQFMEEIKPGSLTAQQNELGLVFALARVELLERKKKEEELEEKIHVIEEENRKMVEEITSLNEAKEEMDSNMSTIKTELEQTESRFLAAKEKLSIAVTKGKQLVQHRDSLKQSLTDKATELDKCVIELQQKTSTLEMMETSNEELQHMLSVKTNELEKCLLELQDKYDTLGRNEATIEDLKELLQEKTVELEKCLQELQLKSDAFDNANTDNEEMRQWLLENKGQLENCLLELQKKSKELETSVANAEMMKQSFTVKICELEMSFLILKQAFSEKNIELEKSLLDLQEKSNSIGTTYKEFDELQNLVISLQDLTESKNKILNEIEEMIRDAYFPQELLSLDIVDKCRWLVTKAHLSDDILQENCKIKDALFSVGVPQPTESDKLGSQVDWLVKSFTQLKDELSRLQSESTHTSALHESELSEALKEVDSLSESLLKKILEKESLLIEYEDLKVDHEKLAENLALISFEKERIIKFLKDICTTCLDDQPSLDIDTLLEKSIFSLRKNLISLNDAKKLEEMQYILHITHIERTLFEKILEEVQVDLSKMISLSDELVIASKEINALKNEKESMKKEIERIEERNSLLRDKLSMAVKKGKGLVQEREVFKVTLDEKKTEIGKLKEELQIQESKLREYVEQINSLSSFPEQLLKLESDIVSLKAKREESEHLLNERNGNLQKLVDSINSIVLHTDNIFETPIDKVNWIAGCMIETENAKAYLALELEKAKTDADLNYSRLVEALGAVKSLEMELGNKEKHIRDIYDEMNNIQATKAKIEENFEKSREESLVEAKQLTEACATIKSLEDKLLLAEDKVSSLIVEKNEIASKSNLEISALNAKIAESIDELVKTRGSSISQLSELFSELRQLELFINDCLFPLMIEQFHKSSEGLRHMWRLIQDIHENLLAKDTNIHSEMERVLSNLSSSTNFEDFTKNEIYHSASIVDDTGFITSCTRIVNKIYKGARFLNDEFTGLSTYMDHYFTFTLQALEASRDEFTHTLHLSDSLKVNIEKLEQRNRDQEFEISSLQTEAQKFLSKCNDATEKLQVNISDLLGTDSWLENIQSGIDLRSPNYFPDKVEKLDVTVFSRAAENLLLNCNNITIQYQNLVKINKEMSNSLENVKHKLNHAEMTVATTLDEKNLIQNGALKLKGDMEALQHVCNEMKAKLSYYQSKENVIKGREIELERLEHSLIAKDREVGDEMISRDQVETLFEKVNKLIVHAGSSHQSESQSQEVCFSSSVDKLFYVVDKFSEFQQGIFLLAFEKEDLQLIIANQIREIKDLKSSVDSLIAENQDLQSKKGQLDEVIFILEKITQKIAQHYPFEDLRPRTAMGLIQFLERQMTSLSMDLEDSKYQVQELQGKLLANDMFINDLSAKVKYLEDLHARIQPPDAVKERALFETSATTMRPEITEIEEGSVGLSSKNPHSASAHVRTTRKGSNDHLVLSIASESEHLLISQDTDDKGHVFKSLNTSGLIPKQGRLIADRVDGIWVSGGRMLMAKPGARLGLIAYSIVMHLWLVGSIL